MASITTEDSGEVLRAFSSSVRITFVRDEIRQFDPARAVRLERDFRKVRFALQRLGTGIAIDEQHRHFVPHRHAREVAVIRLERVGVRDHFHDVRAGGIERVREKHLPFLPRTESYLRGDFSLPSTLK